MERSSSLLDICWVVQIWRGGKIILQFVLYKEGGARSHSYFRSGCLLAWCALLTSGRSQGAGSCCAIAALIFTAACTGIPFGAHLLQTVRHPVWHNVSEREAGSESLNGCTILSKLIGGFGFIIVITSYSGLHTIHTRCLGLTPLHCFLIPDRS